MITNTPFKKGPANQPWRPTNEYTRSGTNLVPSIPDIHYSDPIPFPANEQKIIALMEALKKKKEKVPKQRYPGSV